MSDICLNSLYFVKTGLISGHPLNVTLVNHFMKNSVTVALQWPREDGAIYSVNVLPFTEITNVTSHNSIACDKPNNFL